MTSREGADATSPGRVLAGRYRLEARVAAGGMGEVWRAHDTRLGRTVAVKRLHGGLTDDPSASRRFRREAMTAAALSHPNTAGIYDYFQDAGRPAIVMELVEGESLAARLAREGPLPIAEALRIMDAVLAGLDDAHRNGVIHRDIKPANILLTEAGGVKVADFGIARAAGQTSSTATGSMLGTAQYTSPEQVEGRPATPASDQYAAGVVLYEMLTGRTPFSGETPVAAALARLSTQAEPPRAHRPEIPEAVERVILRALARDPAARFPTAAAMGEALDPRTAPDGASTDVLPLSGPEADTLLLRRPAERIPRRRRWPALPSLGRARRVAMLSLALVAIVLGALLVPRGPGTVAVPDLVRMRVSDARNQARALGLEVVVQRVNSLRDEGEVVRQDIAPETLVDARATTITLSVSNGEPPCCPVPNLIGMTEEEATAALEQASLVLGRTFVRRTADAPDGTVVDQVPVDGTRLSRGNAVDIILARAPDDDDDDDDDMRGRGRGRR